MHAPVKQEQAEALAPRLAELLHGFRASCVIATAVKLGILDQLGAAPASVDELAERLRLHAPSLQRLTRALAALGIVESRENALGLAPMGQLLIHSQAGLREWAMLIAEEYLPAWVELGRSVATGEPAFPAAFGMDVWAHRKANPELDRSFNRVMADQQIRARGSVLSAYDFSDCRLVVDVGGGSGSLLVDILRRYPGARGVLFDQPHVVEAAPAVVKAGGVSERCRIVGGSFLETVPTGGDTYILQYVLHNWSDRDSATILRHCREAMGRSSVLLVIENVVPDAASSSARLAMIDLHMMVMLGGRERTLGEYSSLLGSSGLSVRRCVPGRPAPQVIVAMRDDAAGSLDPRAPG